MTISNISNSNMSFSGISVKATKVKPGKSKEKIYTLPEDNAFLRIDNRGLKNKDYVRLNFAQSENECGINKTALYKDVEILEVDKKSNLEIEGHNLYGKIGTMKNDSTLRLDGTVWANIGKIESKDVKITVGKGNRLTVNDQSTFKVWSPNINSDGSRFATVSGKFLEIKG